MNSEIIQKQLDIYNSSFSNQLKQVGEEARNFFIETFEKKGFTDKNFKAWEKDKESYGGELLEKTGDLKRSIQISEISNNSVTISSRMNYASFINDGTNRMVGRQFMGDSYILGKKIGELFENGIEKAFK